jgi:V-type H+-transporting ATPase subunit a
MKFAVIIGVLQMTFGNYLINSGIALKLVNTRHFKNYLDMIFEWLPQQVFFFCTFGYMCILIIYKWTIPWGIPAGEG